MAITNTTFQQLREMCRHNGFFGRGHAFFRVQGDGVLQVLKYECKKHPFYAERLWLGLFSMYGELQPEWFCSRGAITRYDTRYLVCSRKEREAHWESCMNVSALEDFVVFHLDLSEINNAIFPYMNGIQTQKQLYESMLYAEIQDMGEIIWNDPIKIAPYAASGDYESAARIIRAILNQHGVSVDSVEEIAQSHKTLRDEDIAWADRLAMFERQDKAEIDAYLQANFENNTIYARFCMPKSSCSIG